MQNVLLEFCRDNQVVTQDSPASVSPSGCWEPSGLCECRRSLLEEQDRGFVPSLLSKPPPPAPLQRGVCTQPDPSRQSRVQPWGSAQPVWSLLCHPQPIRYKTVKSQHRWAEP